MDRVRKISACLSKEIDKSVLVYAMGAQRRSQIRQLSQLPGVEVIWSRSLIPGYLAPIRLLIASYAALIRVNDPAQLTRVFESAMDKSMAAIYVLPRESEPGFIEKVTASRSPPTYDFGAKRDPQYLIYMVDADSTESSTGIYEIVSMGYMTAGCIKECFDNF